MKDFDNEVNMMKKIITLFTAVCMLFAVGLPICSAKVIELRNGYGLVYALAQVSDISGEGYEVLLQRPDGSESVYSFAKRVNANGNMCYIEDGCPVKVGDYIHFTLSEDDTINRVEYDESAPVTYSDMRYNSAGKYFYGNGVQISRNDAPLYQSEGEWFSQPYPDEYHTYTLESGAYHTTILDYVSDMTYTIKQIDVGGSSAYYGLNQRVFASGYIEGSMMGPAAVVRAKVTDSSNNVVYDDIAPYVDRGGYFDVIVNELPNIDQSYIVSLWVYENGQNASPVYKRRCVTRKSEVIKGTIDAAAIDSGAFDEVVEIRVKLEDGTKRVFRLDRRVDINDERYRDPYEIMNTLDVGKWVVFANEGDEPVNSIRLLDSRPYIVKFDLMDGRGAGYAQLASNLNELDIPGVVRKDGYAFLGWYANPTGSGQPYITTGGLANATLTRDVTLYAVQKWGQDIEWGVDTYKFGNASYFWGSGYTIRDEHFNKLTDGLRGRDKTLLKNQRKSAYGGSCYGMSVVLAMLKQGYLSAGNIEKGAKNAHDLSYPKNNSNVASVINYYQLSQFLPEVRKELEKQSKAGTTYLAKKLIIDYLREGLQNDPVVIIYDYKDGKKWYQHAVVAYRMEEYEFGYKLSIVDPNYIVHSDRNKPGFTLVEEDGPTYMYIEADGSDVSYDGMEGEHSLGKGTLRLYGALTDDSVYTDVSLLSGEDDYEEFAEQTVLSVNFDEFDIAGEFVYGSVGADGVAGVDDISEGRVYAGSDITEYTMPWQNSCDVTAKNNGSDVYTAAMNFDSEYYPLYIYSEAKEAAKFSFGANGYAGIVTPSVSEKTVTLSAGCSDWRMEDVTLTANVAELYVTHEESDSFRISASSSLKGAVLTVTDALGGETTVTVEDDVTEFAFNCISEEYMITTRLDGINGNQTIESKGSVVFHTEGGTEIATITDIECGGQVQEPATPEREGFIFDGWYGDEWFEYEWDFEYDEVYGCVSLYAAWIPDPSYYNTLTLDAGGEYMQTVTEGEQTVSLSEYSKALSVEGTKILGWTTQEDAEEAEYTADAEITVKEDITLFAIKETSVYLDATVSELYSECYVKVNLKNAAPDAKVVIAGYNQGKLVESIILSTEDDLTDIMLTVIPDTVKVMVWNGQSLAPQVKPVEINTSRWTDTEE